MFRPDVKSRREYLAAMSGMAMSGELPRGESGPSSYCSDPAGRDIISTPATILQAACGDCKKLSILAARRLVEAGKLYGVPRHVELCMTVTDDPEEHVFLRVDGQFRDPAVEAGMPVRQIGDFIAETVWRASPGT